MKAKPVAESQISDKGKPENMQIPKHVLDYYDENK